MKCIRFLLFFSRNRSWRGKFFHENLDNVEDSVCCFNTRSGRLTCTRDSVKPGLKVDLNWQKVENEVYGFFVLMGQIEVALRDASRGTSRVCPGSGGVPNISRTALFCFFFFLNVVICSLEIRSDVRFYAFSVLFSVLCFKVVEPEGVGLPNVLVLILQRNMVNSWRCASQEEFTNISIYFPNRRFYGCDLIQLYETLCSS